MVELTIAELEAAGERDLGVSDWHRVEQPQIDGFADVTGDHFWLHVDAERARAGPFGTTVAHGYLTLSLLPMLLAQVHRITDASTRINYGVDRLRFTAPVRSGSDVRARARLVESERRGDAVVYKLAVEVEVKDEERPAVVAQVLYRVA
jgi:acyl dehydratase